MTAVRLAALLLLGPPLVLLWLAAAWFVRPERRECPRCP